MPHELSKNFGSEACNFIEDIIDGMLDWVRVIDREDTVIFINKSMRQALGNGDFVGKKCYESLNRNSPCPNCL